MNALLISRAEMHSEFLDIYLELPQNIYQNNLRIKPFKNPSREKKWKRNVSNSQIDKMKEKVKLKSKKNISRTL